MYLVMKYRWALIAQRMTDFGELRIIGFFPYDEKTECDLVAESIMNMTQLIEAACFLVY